MNNIIKYAALLVIGFLIGCMFNCKGDSKPTKYTERIVKQFDTITKFDTFRIPPKNKFVYLTKTDTIETENPLNIYYFNKWQEAQGNQNKQDSLYYEAIAEKEYNVPFEDSLIKIDVYTKTRGEILSQSPKYTLKPRPIPNTRYYRLTGGLETGYLSGELLPKANLGYQNAKGYTFEVGYDLDQRVWIGAEIPLITIKR